MSCQVNQRVSQAVLQSSRSSRRTRRMKSFHFGAVVVGALVVAAVGTVSPGGAQVPSLDERVRAALAAAEVSGTAAPTLVSATVDEEGRPLLRAVVSAGPTAQQPERHLAATIVRVPALPRSPGDARTTTVGLVGQPAASDATGAPLLRVSVSGAALEAGGGGAASGFAGVTPGAEVDRLVAPRTSQVPTRLAEALARVQSTLRVELERAGVVCSTAAALIPDLVTEEITLEVMSRCPADPVTEVTLRLSDLRFDLGQRLTSAKLERLTGHPQLGESARVVFVPELLRGQLWDDATPGVTSYDLGGTGSTTIDFQALTAGGETPDCVADATTLCLDDQPNDGRFRVTLSWFTAANGGLAGDASATPLTDVGLPAGGLFSFFEGNPEFLIKVLDGCAINGHFWLFGAPTTTLGFRLEVEDLVAKAAGRLSDDYLRVIDNVDGVTAPSFSLLDAFPACDL